ncbi:TVP38/TMEM64 family protein [Sulfurospirillum diekertiae]|uniref:TVP38/TMEM64 family membrane protein n=1 Tax=Sulfurospirillum diekertiae TaxID=1854492 RepID=A0A6G9VRH0_9BACT|nr:TVP38/TMEM64 family protein [Sulfurospirillum diekertiae]QIR75467.1 TVP38/TMEM64 family protein [Sulfurospirillum diekertiae]QIR78117.1 TVP38/TMEM64 family protein [Sulfurospirillum diekertiae]
MKRSQIILLLLTILCLGLYFTIPSIQTQLNLAVSILCSLNLESVIAYLREFGVYAALISFLLMILQSIIAPIPAFLITLSNAAIFGWALGALLSWSSAMVGAALCFFIARILGRDVVEKLTSKKALDTADAFFERYGKHTIIVCRLLPFISFDLISYAAGLTSIRFWSFWVATGIGQLPATLVYSYFGQNLSSGGKIIFITLLMMFALSIIIYIFKKIYDKKARIS